MKRKVKVGSRDSKLAVAQTMLVVKELERQHPELEFELYTMKTTGDKILDRNLDQIGGKGLFVKELDAALLAGTVDLTIHSLKDLPMEVSPELPLVGYSKREDPRDAIIIKKGREERFMCGRIGTSSRRREEQLKKIFPDAVFPGIRGNVQTRIRKLETEEYDATLLAVAGLKRLGMEHSISRIFSTEEIIPAAGQGILAFQGRKGEDYEYLDSVNSQESKYEAIAERSFVACLDGGCSSPIAAYARVEGNNLHLRGLYYHEPAQDFSVGEIQGSVQEAAKLGHLLANKLRKQWI